MEKQTYSFRSAMNGFHRGDVIHFLEELSLKHQAQMQALQEELRVANEEIKRLQQENDRVQNNTTTQPRAEAMTEDHDALELAAYRRAERCEREAKARAGKIFADVSVAIDTAGKQLLEQELQLRDVSAVLSSDITSLEAAMADIRGKLNGTRERIYALEQELTIEHT